MAQKMEDMALKLTDLKNRANAIEKKKIAAETELSMLEKQYDQYVAELKELGVENIQDLPGLIEQAEEQIKNQVSEVETSIAEIEKVI